jgi:uncharacterized protein (TIGR03382 family)
VGGAALLLRASPTELWRMDSRAPERVWQVDSHSVQGPWVAGRALYLAISSDGASFVLWKSEGAPPTAVAPIGSFPYDFATDGSRAFFLSHSETMNELWRTDGTPEGTSRLATFAISPYPLLAAGSKIFFIDDGALWFADASSTGVKRVVDLAEVAGAGAGSAVRGFLLAPGGALGADVLWYLEITEPSGEASYALWKSDGTREGTARLASLPAPVMWGATASQGLVFFELVDGSGLWRTDATIVGTSLVREDPTIESSTVGSSRLQALPGGGVIFTAGGEPWISDGTTAGTRRLQEIAPYARASSPAGFTVSGDRVFFTADDGLHGRELWVLPAAAKQPEGCACSAHGHEDGPGVPLAVIATAALAALGRARRSTAAQRPR